MNVDCVIIGVNAEKTLDRCIQSVIDSRYTRGKVTVIYTDGGSTDTSVDIARRFDQIQVIELRSAHPSPGLGRNAGWRAGRAPLVQFLDSDTILAPDWLSKAVDAMTPTIGAVRGNREEINPEGSVFNWIGSLEWNAPPGECDDFGGDVLIRRSVLEETDGYDEVLVGGEDPELSQRVRRKGWKIMQLDEPMTRHDLAMVRVSQYLKRSYRSGYGFAAVTSRFGLSGQGFWQAELKRILIRGGGTIGFTAIGLAGSVFRPGLLGLLIPAGVLLFYPRLFSVAHFMTDKQLPLDKARLYAWHCSVAVLPQFFGLSRFYVGKLFNRPLRNKSSSLKTTLS